MRLHWVVSLVALVLFATLSGGDEIRLPDQEQRSGGRDGKSLLDWIGLGSESDRDPYVERTKAACLNGDFAECFKSQALGTFTDFFSKEYYPLTEHVQVIRMPETQLRSLYNEPYEFSSEPRATDTEWDQLVKFGLRKVEKFVKSAAFEISVSDDVSEGGRYSPRFLDEIADEIDVLEDKKAPLFSRKRLRKLFIPMLIILKLFKLKLLLFLPMILGLASFKKLLGFFAIIVPGIIGFFKLCKPNLASGGGFNGGFGNLGSYYSTGPQYSLAGVSVPSYSSGVGNSGPGSSYGGQHYGPYYRDESASSLYSHNNHPFVSPYGRDNSVGKKGSKSGTIAFRDEDNFAEYRNKFTDKE